MSICLALFSPSFQALRPSIGLYAFAQKSVILDCFTRGCHTESRVTSYDGKSGIGMILSDITAETNPTHSQVYAVYTVRYICWYMHTVLLYIVLFWVCIIDRREFIFYIYLLFPMGHNTDLCVLLICYSITIRYFVFARLLLCQEITW